MTIVVKRRTPYFLMPWAAVLSEEMSANAVALLTWLLARDGDIANGQSQPIMLKYVKARFDWSDDEMAEALDCCLSLGYIIPAGPHEYCYRTTPP